MKKLRQSSFNRKNQVRRRSHHDDYHENNQRNDSNKWNDKKFHGHLHLTLVKVAQVSALGHDHLHLTIKEMIAIGEKMIIIYVKVEKLMVGIIIVVVKQIRKHQVQKMIKFQVQLIQSVENKAALGHNHLHLTTKEMRVIGETIIIIYVKVDKLMVGIIIVLVKQIRKHQVHKMIKYQVQLILSV